jgi:hypothetical protein
LANIGSANALIVGSYAVSDFTRGCGFGCTVAHLIAVANGAIGGGATQIYCWAMWAWRGDAVVAGGLLGFATVGLALVDTVASAR